MIFKIEFTNHHDNHFEYTVGITAKDRVTIHEKVKGTGESKQAWNVNNENFANGNGNVHGDEDTLAKHGDLAKKKSEIHPCQKECPTSNMSRSHVIIDLNEVKVETSEDQDQDVNEILPAEIRANPSSDEFSADLEYFDKDQNAQKSPCGVLVDVHVFQMRIIWGNFFLAILDFVPKLSMFS